MKISSSLLTAAAFALVASFATSASAGEDAAKLWKSKCASCHGPDGKGKTKQGEKMAISDLTVADKWKDLNDDKIKKAMMDGIKGEKDGKKQEMKPFKDKLKPEEVDALVAFVKAFAPK